MPWEGLAFKQNKTDDLDRELIEEINRKYAGRVQEQEIPYMFRFRRFLIGCVALILALLFLFTVTGRWLAVFAGPSYQFLRESWSLSADPLVRELRKSVVQIHVERQSGNLRFSGSGFNIEPDGLIVTNRHLVEDAAIVRISFPGRGTFSAQEWTVSPDADLAVIRLSAENLPVLVLSDSSVQPGDELLVIGNPLQYARITNKGILTGYYEAYGRVNPFLVVEAMVYPGNSGSPVFNEAGEVVGIIFATIQGSDPAEVSGLAVDVAELKLFLEESVYQ